MKNALVKEEAHKLVDKMPDDSTWDDLMEEIYVRQVIEQGLADSKTRRTLQHSAGMTHLCSLRVALARIRLFDHLIIDLAETGVLDGQRGHPRRRRAPRRFCTYLSTYHHPRRRRVSGRLAGLFFGGAAGMAAPSSHAARGGRKAGGRRTAIPQRAVLVAGPWARVGLDPDSKAERIAADPSDVP